MKIKTLIALVIVALVGVGAAISVASADPRLAVTGLPVINVSADCSLVDVQLNGTSVCPTVVPPTTVPSTVPTTVPETTVPSTTVPPTTVAPTTVPPTTAAPTTTVAPTTTTTTVAPTTAAPTTTTTTVAPTTTAVPTAFPTSASTGVPSGITLTNYTGSCTITVANTVIDRKAINCDLIIRASGVKVTNSKLTGSIATDENSTGYSFSISDSDVIVGNRAVTGVGAVNFTMLRVEVVGGNRSVNCWKQCDVQDSFVHGQFRDNTGKAHESGVRMGSDNLIRHNTIVCDAPDVPPDAGCSADLTGYGDFGPVERITIDNNLLKASTGGTCAYGGSTATKPYSNAANNIKFTNNVFEHGTVTGKCGSYFAITDFIRADGSIPPGNVWTGNVWDTGGVVPNDG